MNSAEGIIPFEEMCWHARHSLLVNGLRPKEWRWGRDAINWFRNDMPMVKVANAMYSATPMPPGACYVWDGLPVFPMRASGVACIADPKH